jgi:hypothetical protein
METKVNQAMTYELKLTVTRAIYTVYTEDEDAALVETAVWMAGREAKRELEREVLRALRTLDGDCDVEVMSTTIAEDK